MVQLVDPARCV
ncbi:hypothetical protein Q9K79_001047 [Escherichia coli]|nr:hypothetical protein [Escherichia coli]